VDTGVDLTGTVLHELHHPGEQPTFKIGSMNVTVPRLDVFNLKLVDLYDDKPAKVATVVELPDSLRALDTVIGDRLAGREVGQSRLNLVKKEIGKILQQDVVHRQSTHPGIMGFALGADSQLGDREIAVSLDTAAKFLKNLLKSKEESCTKFVQFFLDKMPKNLSQSLLAEMEKGHISKAVLKQAARYLDGVNVYGVRYPNASSTSYEEKTLRVYLDAPSDSIFMKVTAIVKRHQGDFDGDRLGLHLSSKQSGKVAEPLHWNRKYAVAHNAFNLESLNAPEEKSQMEVMQGFSERGRWVGMLTYSFWLLFFSAANWHEELGHKNPGDLCPKVLDLFTPLIEGVMNARKGTGSGTVGGDSLASSVCDMFSGVAEIDSVLSILPVNSTGEYDEEKFTPDQVEFLSKILHLVAGPNKTKCNLSCTSGACYDPVLLAFARRFRNNAVTMLLDQIPGDLDMYTIVSNSILVKGKFPWKNNTPISIRSTQDIQENYDENAE